MIYQNNSFTQTSINESKFAAYCTDLGHCKSINTLIKFPDSEVCALDPSSNEGDALIAVTGASENPNIKTFGVEIQDAVCKKASEKLFCAVCADFLDGVLIKKGAFSFVFGNPPYMTEKDDSGKDYKLEKAFLEKVIPLMKSGGVIAWVIPLNSFLDENYTKLWMRNFETRCIYRFREEEFKKWHQIVLVGIKKESVRKIEDREQFKLEIEDFKRKWNLDNLPILPVSCDYVCEVPESFEKDIDTFTTKHFDQKAAYEFLKNGIPDELLKKVSLKISQKEYEGECLKRPPIPLKKDSLYLLLTSGFHDGEAGTVEDGTLHMMRGVAEVVDHESIVSGQEADDEEVESEKTASLKVVTSTEVEVRVIEQSGKITLLK